MQNSFVAVLLVAVALVGFTNSANVLQRRDGLPVVGDAVSGLPVVGPLAGTATGAVGGLVGAAVGLTGTSDQKAECAKTQCAASACSAQSNTNNTANGSGGLLGVGQLVGPINVNVPICPSICLQCNQLGLATLG